MRDKLSSKRRRLRHLARAAVAERAQQQQKEEEKEAVEVVEGGVGDREVVEVEDRGVEEEGEVEDREAVEAEELLEGEGEGEGEELQQKQQQQQVGELEIGEILHGPFSHGISASISCEELEERTDCIKEDPYLKSVIEHIDIGGPDVMMRYFRRSYRSWGMLWVLRFQKALSIQLNIMHQMTMNIKLTEDESIVHPHIEIAFMVNREKAADCLNSLEKVYVNDQFLNWDPEHQGKAWIVSVHLTPCSCIVCN